MQYEPGVSSCKLLAASSRPLPSANGTMLIACTRAEICLSEFMIADSIVRKLIDIPERLSPCWTKFTLRAMTIRHNYQLLHMYASIQNGHPIHQNAIIYSNDYTQAMLKQSSKKGKANPNLLQVACRPRCSLIMITCTVTCPIPCVLHL